MAEGNFPAAPGGSRKRTIKRNFAPGFRVAWHQTDLNLALQGAPQFGRQPAERRGLSGVV